MAGLFDPSLLSTLRAVSEEASFSKAGERIGLTQQAVSAQIKRLEEIAGRRLAERRSAGVRLTADGEALIAYARLLSETTEQVRRQFSAVPLRGSVRIGVLEGFASTGLAAVLAAFRTLHPDLELVVEAAETEVLLARLENGNLDVIFGAQRRGQGRGDSVACVQLGWYGDLSGYEDASVPVRLVVRTEPSLPRAIAIEALVRSGRHYGIVFESGNRTSLLVAAMSGLGVSVFATVFDNGMEAAKSATMPELDDVEFFLAVGRRADDVVRTVSGLVKESITAILADGPRHLV